MGSDPYAGKTDLQVFQLAKAALLKEAMLQPGTIERSIQSLAFDGAMMELKRRAMRQVLEKMKRQEA